MIEKTVRIRNELGLHARAAAKLVRLTSKFESDIQLGRTDNHQQVDGKSILGILLLAAAKGTEIRLTAAGPDEQQAADAIVRLVESGFDEDR